jgi:hypothetical protein
MCLPLKYRNNYYVTPSVFKSLRQLGYKYVSSKSSYTGLSKHTLLKILKVYSDTYAVCTDTINNIYLIEITNLKEA